MYAQVQRVPTRCYHDDQSKADGDYCIAEIVNMCTSKYTEAGVGVGKCNKDRNVYRPNRSQPTFTACNGIIRPVYATEAGYEACVGHFCGRYRGVKELPLPPPIKLKYVCMSTPPKISDEGMMFRGRPLSVRFRLTRSFSLEERFQTCILLIIN